MATFLLTFGVSGSRDEEGRKDDGEGRRVAAYTAAFELGPAWHGGQSAIFLTTDKTIDQVAQHVLEALDSRDLLVVLEIDERRPVLFAGNRFDDEGFAEIFPHAAELEHRNLWRPSMSRSGDMGDWSISRKYSVRTKVL